MGDDGGRRKRKERLRGEAELMTGRRRERKQRRGEDTETSGKSFKIFFSIFFIGLQRCAITKMTADDNSGQLTGSPPICCCIDGNEMYQERSGKC